MKVSLHGSLGRSSHEAVKVKFRLSERFQNVRERRVMVYLPEKDADRMWNKPKK